MQVILSHIVAGIIYLVLFGALLLLRRLVHKEGIRSFGLHFDKRGMRLLAEGLVLGVVSFGLYPLASMIGGNGTIRSGTYGAETAAVAAGIWTLIFLVVALFEECLVRGYLLQKLLARTNAVVAIGISSVCFAALHFLAYEDSPFFWLGIFNACLIGVVLGYAVVRTQSLMFAVGYHWTWNLVQTLLLMEQLTRLPGPVNLHIEQGFFTGTSTVPESGAIVTVVVVLIGLYVWARFGEAAETA